MRDVDALLTKVATLAHNRTFTTRDWLDYGGARSDLSYLCKSGILNYDHDDRDWYPTTKGWEAIDKLCE